ncbi:hypothetical protein KFU94_40835 [Chloroflexi bacterium TSY]|nr:hypothetical protein [Chloroflexi bacterium TSY]
MTTCPHFGQDCSGSAYGRVVYTYPKDNYRLHTRIPRDSDLWQLHANARSCAERSVKRKSTTFISSRPALLAATDGSSASLAAMCQHVDAWLHHAARRLA